MKSSRCSLTDVQRQIDEVKRFLSVTLAIANAHTVEFYTHDVWKRFVAVSPQEVLSAVSSGRDQQGERSRTTFGFCVVSNRLVDIHELLEAAKAQSLPGLGACMSRDELLRSLRGTNELEPDEFMNAKKSHEVQCMSKVVAHLARHCGVKQVIDVGSGKGYLSSFLSLQYGLQVFGIDSSSTNTHGAQERNRKLKKFSRAYQKHAWTKREAPSSFLEATAEVKPELNQDRDALAGSEPQQEERVSVNASPVSPAGETQSELNSGAEELFLSALSADVIQPSSPRVPPGQLSAEERERRKRENLEKKARARGEGADGLFSPLTSYVTAETELRELITELEEAIMVGLHTCGDLAASTLRMFVAKPELSAVCGVGCCYHLLSEDFNPDGQEKPSQAACGFPLSQYLRDQSWFCGRNARMSACLALERVSLGQGIQMESLFYRAVLHVILRDHYKWNDIFLSAMRFSQVFKTLKQFTSLTHRLLPNLRFFFLPSALCDSDIQSYHDAYVSRMDEMHAFNMLKVTLAPCIEGLILLDRLCYLKEEVICYAIVGLKSHTKLKS
uniref:Methyltransferase like 25 n=1 Tax=Fundulus heteroclitus TaxID=8078 RepID=A0A3Q2TS30_FUNHE